MTTLVRDLLALPAQVNKGDFVQSLSASLNDPTATIDTYAVTGDLVANFREAIKVVASAVANGRSQPVFLHGSFGSGKSHFMAVLHLMLGGHAAPWRKPALHPVRATFAPLEGKRLLQLHFHMLGSDTIEATVFGGYVAHVRREHPTADLPALFRDREVFGNATRLRTTMGDAGFFGALNAGKQVVAGFGTEGDADIWSADRFEAALQSTDLTVRAGLLTALTRTLLPAFAGQTDRFVSIDEGLGELSRHAADLGYDGVVLYLDELILWLASRSADMPFVQREFNKLVKLKEAQDEARAIPIVAFIARQRDLSSLIGDAGTGAERALIEEAIAHHRSRFHTIDLSDSNLRAIIPHRVVIARSADDRQRLEDGFEKMWRTARTAASTLQAGTTDRAGFLQVYPFSPALIEALVVLSNRLQRDRTAIRILVEMLVEHLPDLALGEVVPVGDVFDLVAGSDDAVDGPSRAAFERARELYLDEILPHLQARHQTTTPTACQRLRPDARQRIGCSGCPQMACRADNRLIKTVLLAALVPKAQPFDGLTVKRLVHLNHGSVQAPVETMAVNMAATRLRELSNSVHALSVSDDADSTVTVSLESIDLRPILQRADDQDTRERRRYVVRTLLWRELGFTTEDNQVTHTVDYHCTRRSGRVLFGNVRTLRADRMICPPEGEWMVVIDYPFDDEGYAPSDDESRLDALRTELHGQPAHCAVWLPTFFSKRVQDDLGDLARLTHILERSVLPGFLSHVPPDLHQRAQIDLQSLHDRKAALVREALKRAYGMARQQPDDPHLDLNRTVEQHVRSVDGTFDGRTPRSARMSGGLADLAEQVLRARYPAHPKFEATPSPARLGRVRALIEPALDAATGMLPAAKTELEELRKVGGPLYLCTVLPQQFERQTRQYDAIEAARTQAGVDDPTLDQVRGWLDPDERMGLTEPTSGLVAWLWAYAHRRVAMLDGVPIEWPVNGRLASHVVFVRPDLPGEAVWGKALDRAGWLGVATPGKSLNARNMARLAAALRGLLKMPAIADCGHLPGALEARLAEHPSQAAALRLGTAVASSQLAAALGVPGDRALLDALATVDLSQTSGAAIARHVGTAPAVKRALGDASWTVLALVRGKLNDDRKRERAHSILERVATLLRDDELNAPLVAGLHLLVEEARALLQEPKPQTFGWVEVWRGDAPEPIDAAEALARLDALRAQLAIQIDQQPAPARVRMSIALEVKKSETP